MDRIFIESLSYTDFVGLINQWNVLPGGFTTLSKRIQYGNIQENSRILEMACTTGFSIREISHITGCTGVGIDISERSIQAAKENQKNYGGNSQIKYYTQDAYTFNSEMPFTHIIVGAALKFFPDQKKAIEKIVSLFNNEGILLASPFYVTKKIPDYLVKKAKKIFGINITTEGYNEVMDIYNKFEILYEERCIMIQETEEEIRYYAKCTIDRTVKALNIIDSDIYDAMFTRLVEIKTMSNELRPYQKYVVLVLRYREKIYPNRFIELF